MKKGFTECFCGTGKGKTSLAIGKSVRACSEGKSVIMIQFLKGRETGELSFLEKAGEDIKIFRFEKSDGYYEALSPREQEEQNSNIRNGLNYARKVITTNECDVLVLDEILGLPDLGIASCEEINELLMANHSGMHIMLTGQSMYKELMDCLDSVTYLETERLTELE